MLRFSHVSDLLALVKNLTSSSRANPKDRIICWEKPEESVLRGHWSDEKQRRSALTLVRVACRRQDSLMLACGNAKGERKRSRARLTPR